MFLFHYLFVGLIIFLLFPPELIFIIGVVGLTLGIISGMKK